MTTVASIWTLFGLNGDPFFQDPLRADAEADSPRSADRFVGRAQELAIVTGAVAGADPEGSSRTVVEGDIGVGKTSFVNRAKSLLAGARQPIVLTHEQPVRMRDGMTPRGFAADVLRTLLRIHETFVSAGGAAARESTAAEAFWRRIRRLVHGEDTATVGLSVVGVGGSVGYHRIAAEEMEGALYDEVEQAFALLSGGRSVRGDARRRIVIHVNNLEHLSLSAMAAASQLAQHLRDYWLIPGSHWIFVGATGIDVGIFRAAQQVSGIVPPPVTLGPLSSAEVSEVLQLRYRALQRGKKLIPPVTPAAIDALYARYGGDLRNFLRVLSNGVRSAAVAATAPLEAADVLRAVAGEYRRALAARIGEETMGYLDATVQTVAAKAPTLVFRATDIARASDLRVDHATRILTSLAAAAVVRFDHREGRSVYYRLAGDTSVALGTVM